MQASRSEHAGCETEYDADAIVAGFFRPITLLFTAPKSRSSMSRLAEFPRGIAWAWGRQSLQNSAFPGGSLGTNEEPLPFAGGVERSEGEGFFVRLRLCVTEAEPQRQRVPRQSLGTSRYARIGGGRTLPIPLRYEGGVNLGAAGSLGSSSSSSPELVEEAPGSS